MCIIYEIYKIYEIYSIQNTGHAKYYGYEKIYRIGYIIHNILDILYTQYKIQKLDIPIQGICRLYGRMYTVYTIHNTQYNIQSTLYTIQNTKCLIYQYRGYAGYTVYIIQ